MNFRKDRGNVCVGRRRLPRGNALSLSHTPFSPKEKFLVENFRKISPTAAIAIVAAEEFVTRETSCVFPGCLLPNVGSDGVYDLSWRQAALRQSCTPHSVPVASFKFRVEKMWKEWMSLLVARCRLQSRCRFTHARASARKPPNPN